jgi:hypothetical protein
VDKITHGQEKYGNDKNDFESMSYLSSVYVMTLASVESDVGNKILSDYNKIHNHNNYTINIPDGKRMIHTIRTLDNEITEGNQEKYKNFIKAITKHGVLPDNFMTLVDVKLLNENIHNQVIECCMGVCEDVDFSPFKEYSKHQLIKIMDIRKHINGIRE